MQNSSPLALSKQLRSLNFFWLGFILYTLGNTLASTTLVDIKVCQAIQIPGLLLITILLINLIQFKFDNSYLSIIYTLYCVWLFTLVVRGFNSLFDHAFLKSFLFNPYEGMLYFAPLLLLFSRNQVFLKKLFDVIVILGIFYIIYDIVFIKNLLNSDRTSSESQGIVETFSDLSFASGFLLLTYAYHSKKRQLLALGVMILSLLFAVIRARRSLILEYANMMLFSYVLYIFHSKMKLLIIFVTILICLFGAVYISSIYKPRDSRLFGFLVDRGNENTRSSVELYFYNDMKTEDWIKGRGMDGKYFCPDIEEDQLTNYRNTIETGYEQTILKGGLISLVLFLLIAVPAVIKGLFYSKNILSKAAGIWIFMSLINSYPTIVNSFKLQYLLVWISIGICYSKEIRTMPENAIKEYFAKHK